MKAKQIQIGIRSEGEVFDDFIAAAEALERGEKVREEHGVYFTSLEAFRKAVTPKRLALLHLIRTARPASLNELARLSKRNIKNVADDVRHLAQIGLIECSGEGNRLILRVNYEVIDLRIAV